MRPARPACGTVSNAQLLTLREIIRIIAPGVVTTQLSSLPPASTSATEVLGSSESRLATAQPPEPPPTTTKSNVSATLDPPVCAYHFRVRPMAFPDRLLAEAGLLWNSWQERWFWAFWQGPAVINPQKNAAAALSKADLRWYIPLAPLRLWPLGCLLRKPSRTGSIGSLRG